ncbi:hypothetical protein VTI28DRAFT_9183 [Corynascus sepedonium]
MGVTRETINSGPRPNKFVISSKATQKSSSPGTARITIDTLEPTQGLAHAASGLDRRSNHREAGGRGIISSNKNTCRRIISPTLPITSLKPSSIRAMSRQATTPPKMIIPRIIKSWSGAKGWTPISQEIITRETTSPMVTGQGITLWRFVPCVTALKPHRREAED